MELAVIYKLIYPYVQHLFYVENDTVTTEITSHQLFLFYSGKTEVSKLHFQGLVKIHFNPWSSERIKVKP